MALHRHLSEPGGFEKFKEDVEKSMATEGSVKAKHGNLIAVPLSFSLVWKFSRRVRMVLRCKSSRIISKCG